MFLGSFQAFVDFIYAPAAPAPAATAAGPPTAAQTAPSARSKDWVTVSLGNRRRHD